MSDIMRMGRNPNYLGTWDIDELPNKEATLTIEKIVDEKVVDTLTGKDKMETLCYWTDSAFKPMILNITNKKRISKLYKTKDTEKLKGKSVIIGIEKVKAFGDIYEVLRIQTRMPKVTNAVKPKCEKCGKDINGAGNMSPEETASYTKKKYGKAMCSACATKAAKAVQS